MWMVIWMVMFNPCHVGYFMGENLVESWDGKVPLDTGTRMYLRIMGPIIAAASSKMMLSTDNKNWKAFTTLPS